MSEWVEVTLGEISDDVSYGYTESASTEAVGPKFLRITDIQGGIVNWDDVPYCPINEKDLKKYKLQKGEIVVARTGNSTGENYRFDSDIEAVYASYLIKFTLNSSVNSKFVWYTLRSPKWWGFIKGNKTGSAQAGANAKTLSNFPLLLPSIEEQESIAHILGTLDDKIEVNRKMNTTLEAMAQAVFKSWFVDFDPVLDNALAQGNKIPEALKAKAERRKAVPDSKKLLQNNPKLAALFPASFVFNETLDKWIPEGWSLKSIYDFVDIEYGAPFSSKLFNTDGNGTPVIRIRDLKTGTPQNWTTEEHPKGILIKQGDLIVGMDAEFRPCLWQGQDGFLNQRLFRAKPKKDYISNIFLYHALEPLLLYEEQAQVGTTVAHLGKKDIDKFEIIDVGHDLIKEYSKTANPILDRVNTANSEIFTLTTTRDTLLPQLISGRVRVKL